MTDKIIQHGREINEKKGTWVIWGAGSWGIKLLQQVRACDLDNVFIYDTCISKTQDLREQISMQSIMNKINESSFIITARKQQTIDEIEKKILDIGGCIANIYRFIPEKAEDIRKRLNVNGIDTGEKIKFILDDLQAKDLMERKIKEKNPFLMSRWGTLEGNTVYADKVGLFIEGELLALKNNAGFYPLDKTSINNYIQEGKNAARQIDILCVGPWCPNVEELCKWYSPNATLVGTRILSPFWDDISWTSVLKDKKVLVIHPFAKLMEQQYLKRCKLFESENILPEMELIIYPAVQSMNGSSEFESWFDAFKKMKEDIKKIDFEVALLGCGAYGMPLGAFIKRELRKQAIHLGGTLQLLFGIKGKRWDKYNMYNEYWVRPTEDLKPRNYESVEGGCYW